MIETHLPPQSHALKYTHKEGSAVDDTHTGRSRMSGDMPGITDIL